MSERDPRAVGGSRLLWPFLIGDVLLLGAAFLIFWQAHRPMTPVEVVVVAACTALGALLGAWPFVLQQRAALTLAEADRVADSVAQIQQVELVAERIAAATAKWQTAQDHAARTVTAARDIADRMSRESRDFFAFFDKADQTEKAHLRLEVEKLRRAEADWLQVLVRILDHVYALQQAALRSGKPNVANQISVFQDACRDAARRVGLVPVTVEPGTPFDAKAHQPLDPNAPLPERPVVAQVVGTGYHFQGRPLRPVVVVLKSAETATTQPSEAPNGEIGEAPPAAALPVPDTRATGAEVPPTPAPASVARVNPVAPAESGPAAA
jgi:molecular chaperone GrpE (heat shock protein)